MQTIGERLEEARKRKGISIREAAEATKIRGDYLQKFESNQFDFNLAELYVRGFLRSYAQFLKLPADRIVNDFNALGIGSRPRTPSREIYGRMDLSVATADGADAGNEPPSPGSEPAPASRRQPAPFARTGSSLPPAPAIDPNLVIKGSIGLLVAIVAALLIWGIYSFFATPATPAAPSTQASNPPPAPIANPEYIFEALDTVTLTVWREDPTQAGGYGPQIVPPTVLERGRTLRLQRPGPYIVGRSVGANLAISADSQRLNSGTGQYIRLP